MHSRPNAPAFHYSNTPLLVAFMILVLTAACDRLPGKPKLEERWKPGTEVTDFSQLYAQNCSGCHGADGRLGAARPLNDPLYLALASGSRCAQRSRAACRARARPPLLNNPAAALPRSKSMRWSRASGRAGQRLKISRK
jgi:hypothetical protein